MDGVSSKAARRDRDPWRGEARAAATRECRYDVYARTFVTARDALARGDIAALERLRRDVAGYAPSYHMVSRLAIDDASMKIPARSRKHFRRFYERLCCQTCTAE